MTTNLAALAVGILIWYGLHKLEDKIRYHRSKRLYINEVKCPKCGARPNVRCTGEAFDGLRYPYTCMARWYAVEAENEIRERRRESYRKSKTGKL